MEYSEFNPGFLLAELAFGGCFKPDSTLHGFNYNCWRSRPCSAVHFCGGERQQRYMRDTIINYL